MQNPINEISTFSKSNTPNSINGFGSSLAPKWGAGLTPISGFANPYSSKQDNKRKMSFEDEYMSNNHSPEISKPKRSFERKLLSTSKINRHTSSFFPSDRSFSPEKNSSVYEISQDYHSSEMPSLQKSPSKKRSKTSSSSPQGINLDKLLEPLEKKDLLIVLLKLVEKNRHLEKDLRESLPTPTIASACSQLQRLESIMQNSVPYTKAGPVYNEYTYNRLKPALEELHNTIVMYVDHFCQGGLVELPGGSHHPSFTQIVTHPSEWFELLNYATGIVCRMPTWDNPSYNQIRTDSLKYMSNAWLRAITATFQWIENGHVLGQDMVSSWGKSLSEFSVSCRITDMFSAPILAFSQQLGWMTENYNSSFLISKSQAHNSFSNAFSLSSLPLSDSNPSGNNRPSSFGFAWPAN
ncbi:Tethering factor for nuclear proteasome STS1 [Smittium culicis]|uniref:Tethering factor for nuclear proteasome STS1 n=1 Tax=Smittium culicis TaxID=133412 RepID=A0A1R1XVE0_9FUNG|nr:Tethering factor for nuclear proteasome STS1 [Smittium culicis]OMJ19780.1 Tethering factor for nuclear proteasome STS1 [Smittium culicis]